MYLNMIIVALCQKREGCCFQTSSFFIHQIALSLGLSIRDRFSLYNNVPGWNTPIYYCMLLSFSNVISSVHQRQPHFTYSSLIQCTLPKSTWGVIDGTYLQIYLLLSTQCIDTIDMDYIADSVIAIYMFVGTGV